MPSLRNSQPRRVLSWAVLALALSLISRPGSAAPTVLPIAIAPSTPSTEAQTPEDAEKARRKRIARYNAMAQRVAGMPDNQVVIDRGRER